MITHLFIHASLAVKNLRDGENFILDNLGNASILQRMIMRFQKSVRIGKINIVISDSDCDNLIEQTVQRAASGLTDIPVSVIRIPQNAVYRIDESNRYINPALTMKIPHYGFYCADCMVDYQTYSPIDCAVIFNIEDIPLIEADTIDWLIDSYHKKGVLLQSVTDLSQRLIIVPMGEFHARVASLKYRLQRDLKDAVADIKETCAELKLNTDCEQAKIQTVTGFYTRPALCTQILDSINDGSYSCKDFPQEKLWQLQPLHTKSDYEFLDNFYKKYDTISPATFIGVEKEIAGDSNMLYPGMIEVELTNRCNMMCADCPKIVSSRPDHDMDEQTYKKIADQFADKSTFLFLSGYGEPTLHPRLIEFISYAKEKKFHRVCLETNGSMIDESFMEKLIGSGLDILCFNLDAIDSAVNNLLEYPSESVVTNIIKIKEKMNSRTPYIVLQTINRSSCQEPVTYYYRRWEHIADAVVVLPYNDYLGAFSAGDFIDLTPSKEPQQCCKTSQMLLILSDGKPTLCRQKFDGFAHAIKSDYNDVWLSNYPRGKQFEFCANCALKHYNDVKQFYFLRQQLTHKLRNKLYLRELKKELDKSEKLIESKKYVESLDIIEQVLRLYPDCEEAINKLNRLACLK